MRIRLDQVRREPVSWDETVDIPAERLDRQDVLELGPISWSGRVTHTEDGGFYLRAHLEYEQTLACHRCLEPVTEPVSADVDLLLLVGAPRAMDGEVELDEEDLGVVHVDGETFDLRPLLEEQLQLAVPMKPVCREDCKGLCAQCGADLNEGACDCEDDWVDPRWAALQELKD